MSIFNEIFTTKGRLNRLRYLKHMLALALIAGIGTFVTSCMAAFLTGSHESLFVMMVTGMWGLVAGLGNVALIIRRLHDIGKSGWFALILIVPVVNTIFSIAMFFIPGQIGYNQYGADPLESNA